MRRSGFTLVELLVVIAIIGVLIALLLPAVQAAREAARSKQCLNNLKQLGLALELYHGNLRRYPPGREDTGQFGSSWAFRLLPYLEQQAIYDSFDMSVRSDDIKNSQAMRTPVSVYFCPTRRSPTADRDFDNDGSVSLVPGVAAAGDYAANAGLYHNYKTPPELGGPEDDDTIDLAITAGLMFTHSRISAKHVTDGLSNTFAIGERHIPLPGIFGDTDLLHLRQGDTAFFAADTAATIFGDTGAGLASGPMDTDVTKFGSEHNSIVHFLFLDGHVAVIDDSVDLELLQKLSVIADGGEIAEEALEQGS